MKNPISMTGWSLTAKTAVIIALLTLSGLAALATLTWVVQRDQVQVAGIASGTSATLADIARLRIDGVRAVVDTQLKLVGEVRSAQLQFQMQVSDWKSLIQRGGRPDQLQKFTAAFNAREPVVRMHCEAAKQLIGDDAVLTQKLAAFVAAYTKLMVSYRNGMAMIDMAESFRDGAKSADDYMINRDLEPIATLDALVDLAGKQAVE